MSEREWRPQTLEVLKRRNFHDPAQDPFGALTPPEQGLTGPVYTSIAYRFADAEQAAAIFSGGKMGYAYPRVSCGTPPVRQLAQRLLDLELGEWERKNEYDVLLTSSGMAAIALTALTLADGGGYGGGQLISSTALYGGTYHLFAEYLPRLAINCTFVDNPLDLEDWKAAIFGAPYASFMFAEDDANPLPVKLDNKALADLAHQNGMFYICDRTIGTPILEKPIVTADVDVVIHSLSKNIAGYSAGLGGAIIAKKEIIQKIRDGWFVVLGAVMDPRVADYILWGMQDLEKRMEQKIRTAALIARWLKNHPKVAKVYGPGGDLLAFEIKGTLADAQKVIEAYKLIVFAPHLGDIRTLSIHPASTTHSKVPQKERERLGISDTLIRLSVGLEDPLDIAWDLEQALSQIKEGG